MGKEDSIRTPIWDAIARTRKLYYEALEGGALLGELVPQTSEGAIIPLMREIPVRKEFGYQSNMKVIQRIPFFTFTSKMSCVSFSLPSGIGLRLGSCPSSELTKPRFAEEILRAQAEGHYTDGTRVAQHGFRAPVNPKTGKTVGSVPFSRLSGLYICDGCYAGKGKYWGPVQFAQIGRKLWAERALARGTFVPEMTAALRAVLSDDDLMLKKLASNRYVRIHDSGDFFSVEYMYGWFAVCANFLGQDVVFWAPTRVWVIPAFRAAIAAKPPPPNLVLRPSQLVFGADAPKLNLPGVAAGSTASAYSMAHRGHLDCPAYQSVEGSCAEVNCRVCWDQRETPVSYWAH